MSTLLLLIVPPLVILVIIMMSAIWLTNVLADHFVGQKHRLLEEIMDTGKVPALWANQDVKTGRKTLRKLNKLINYAQTTPLVGDEETRELLLTRLNEARADWISDETHD